MVVESEGGDEKMETEQTTFNRMKILCKQKTTKSWRREVNLILNK
jgi:hypothetical protein